MDPLESVDFSKSGGLLTAIAVDDASGDILMVAQMNEEALRRTLDSGEVHYWSRSKGRLWHKGEESGNTQAVMDGDIDKFIDAYLSDPDLRGQVV